jgi:hypothetical protein
VQAQWGRAEFSKGVIDKEAACIVRLGQLGIFRAPAVARVFAVAALWIWFSVTLVGLQGPGATVLPVLPGGAACSAATMSPRAQPAPNKRRKLERQEQEGRAQDHEGLGSGYEDEDTDEVTMDANGRIAFGGRLDFGFRAYASALQMQGPQARASGMLLADCHAAFVHGGVSFWVGAGQKARCGLEELALTIFKHHTGTAKFDPHKSGVEWWVQVRRKDAGTRVLRSSAAIQSIGMHWDKDEDLVDEQGINIHPHISTVTYLTTSGAPTLVLNQRCPVEYDAVPEVFGEVSEGWLSFPLAGKHMSFDGQLLHGAPHQLAPPPVQQAEVRVTFLANVWLNYHPSGLEVMTRLSATSLSVHLTPATSLSEVMARLSTDFTNLHCRPAPGVSDLGAVEHDNDASGRAPTVDGLSLCPSLPRCPPPDPTASFSLSL